MKELKMKNIKTLKNFAQTAFSASVVPPALIIVQMIAHTAAAANGIDSGIFSELEVGYRDVVVALAISGAFMVVGDTLNSVAQFLEDRVSRKPKKANDRSGPTVG